jgi:tryptophan halogenase
MCAAALVSVLKANRPEGLCDVRLIESDEIGSVGVGEATLPHIKDFNDLIGVNEADFMRRTQATFKLGIQFTGWGRKDADYIHPFGDFGHAINGVDFIHHWTRAREQGAADDLEAYSFAVQAARGQRFDFPSDDATSIKSTYSYAYHFDAALYAAYLREFAEARGLKRTEGRIVDMRRAAETDTISEIVLASGEIVSGDLFIDCTGFRALLIGQTLASEWQDWRQWLPCDRAVAIPSEHAGPLSPYTQSAALEAGWKWRIPLQHRTGNGYVYASAFLDDDAALRRLSGLLDGRALGEAKALRFSAGRRLQSWKGNCVAIGLASGFLEPLESTSIYLIQVAITHLLQRLPTPERQPLCDDRLIHDFNRRIDLEYDRVRDFLILHYHANQRDDGELWRYTREMTIPDSLTETIAVFRHRGSVPSYREGLFSPASWLAVLVGQDLAPQGYEWLADLSPYAQTLERLAEIRRRIDANVADMPRHDAFIAGYCPARTQKGGAV